MIKAVHLNDWTVEKQEHVFNVELIRGHTSLTKKSCCGGRIPLCIIFEVGTYLKTVHN